MIILQIKRSFIIAVLSQSFLTLALTVILVVAIFSSTSGQVTGVKYLIKYNPLTTFQDCYIVVTEGSTTTSAHRVQFNGLYSLVVPTGTEIEIAQTYMPLQNNYLYDGTIPAKWAIMNKIQSPEITPDLDYCSIFPAISPASWYNNIGLGDTIKLFSLKTLPVYCNDEVRLFDNLTDPKAGSPGLGGSDLSSVFKIGGAGDDYKGNLFEAAFCGNYQHVSGVVFNDVNSNSTWEEGIDFPLANAAISVEGNNNIFYSNDDGFYNLRLESGLHKLSVSLPYGQWQTNTSVITFNVDGQDTIVNFGFSALPSHPSAMVSISSNPLRCNTYNNMYLSSRNLSSEPINGNMSLKIENGTLVRNMVPTPIQQSDTLLTWKVVNLQAGALFKVRLDVFTPLPNGQNDSMDFDLVFVINEQEILDSFHVQGQIRCSFDPNDKQSWPDRKGEENLTLKSEHLRYTIRFQNTGNDTAFYVRLDDVLDPHLDVHSLIILDASHDVRTELCNGDTLCFIFDNIALTDSATNLAESQGYVTFTIDDLPDTPEGTVITNTAGIVFDLNKPVITNTVQNTIVQNLPCPIAEVIYQMGERLVAHSGGKNYCWYECRKNKLIFCSNEAFFVPKENGVYYAIIESDYCSVKTECAEFKTTGVSDLDVNFSHVYPTIFADQLFVESSEAILNTTIYDAAGKMVKEENYNDNSVNTILQTPSLVNGIYTLIVLTKNNRHVHKLIKINY